MDEAEEQRRAADREHRRKVNFAVKADLIGGAGLTEQQAERVVIAMARGSISHVRIGY